MTTLRNILFAVMATLSADMAAYADPLSFQSPQTQTSLLELFSSEGCSSCPPAETWLTALKTSPRLWHDFVPVAFHVDYWDYLGWRDPWGAETFSDRQRVYAQFWKSDSIYTPCFVLNGHEWSAWARQKDGPGATRAKPGVLKTYSQDFRHWKVNFIPTGARSGAFNVYAALMSNDLISEVKAGENRGRKLVHDFVVTSLRKVPLKLDDDEIEFRGEFSFEGLKGAPDTHVALAVWVTVSDSLEPLQAAGGWLAR